MRASHNSLVAFACSLLALAAGGRTVAAREAAVVLLPDGVKAVWDVDAAYRESSQSRERVCLNGLWRWQPSRGDAESVPDTQWGYFKVPGSWPGITDYMQKDCQTVFPHPAWKDERMGGITAAWYQREIRVPETWTGRRVVLSAEYVNSLAIAYVDGRRVGEVRFPGGELDLSTHCRPGQQYVLSLHVVALPLEGVMLSYNDTASARKVRGSVARRGLCGDLYLESTPAGPRVRDVKVVTSVRNGSVQCDAALQELDDRSRYVLEAAILDGEQTVRSFRSEPFQREDTRAGRIAFSDAWKPDTLWDVHTPQHMFRLRVTLLQDNGDVLDAALPVRFGFREFWIDGKDFYLNGTRIFLSCVPLDNAQLGAAWATYDAARESLRRLQRLGINFVYTHNYGCQPGDHLSFEEILRAADDTGMLVAFSQPHFGHYNWDRPDADSSNGYAEHAAFYVRVAQNHPSVVAYATSHNATGYGEDMNPDLIDGIAQRRNEWSERNVSRARRVEAIINGLDASRFVYHHSSGNFGTMHTINFYANFVPIQEMSDWFEHWAARGVKPVFTCEYSVPMSWDWTMYRGWYQGRREFGSAVVPWELCIAPWNAQFLGDAAYKISDQEKRNLRWETKQFQAGNCWHRWDYPHQVGATDFDERFPIYSMYLADNWPAFRTWGVSAISPWEHGHYWKLRAGVAKNRRELDVDWQHIARPGFSPDYIDEQYERVDLAFQPEDWIPTDAAKTLLRTNQPLLAYLAGKPTAFTSKDHNFCPGETVEKQLIVINNSRQTVTAACRWELELPQPAAGTETIRVATGQQHRIPLAFTLPDDLQAGTVRLRALVEFSTGETQEDSLHIDVLPQPLPTRAAARFALFDPPGDTKALLESLGTPCDAVDARSDLSAYDVLVIGRHAITLAGDAPNVARVHDGLKVILFEQAPEVLESRFGFRIATYGLRTVFKRVADHPVLAGLNEEHLRNWRGEATLVPPRLDYIPTSEFGDVPTVRWCGIPVTRLWRCGNRGNVASALIEKPPRGDFLPILDGGYGLQYSPLLEYRAGNGMVLFCQMDVTGRTDTDPAARHLARNIVDYVASWKPAPRRRAVYAGGPAGADHLTAMGVPWVPYADHVLTDSDVLVVAPDGASQMSGSRGAIAKWLDAGGHMLALGLDESQATALLPQPVHMRSGEYIAGHFEPVAANSPLAGLGPADVYNAAPRLVPLVTGGAQAFGDGVLATAGRGNVVLLQLPPYEITRARGAVPSLAVDGNQPAQGQRAAVVTMGTVPWCQVGQKVKAGTEGTRYTFSAMVRSLAGPVQVRLEVERAGSPWDRAARGDDVTCPESQWQEVHVSFDVDKPYPEGWSAYIHCGQEGARFQADAFQLYEGDHVSGREVPDTQNLFANPGFETGTEPWFFSYRTQQYNLIRTYRRTSFALARLLGNLGVAGSNPLLERFATPVENATGNSLVKNGDFSADADGNGLADEWILSPAQPDARPVKMPDPLGGFAQPLFGTPAGKDGKPSSTMLAQHDVPLIKGQWYRISFHAKAEQLAAGSATMTITNMAKWVSLFDYQRFLPDANWQAFRFEVQANDSVDKQTRLQIWFSGTGTLWLANVRIEPIGDPTQGRWREGLYLDVPQEWDDPYRFFRW